MTESSYDKAKLPFNVDPMSIKIFFRLLTKIPYIARVALLHLLQASPQSKYLDLRTNLSIAVLRSFLTPDKPQSITATQNLLNQDPGIKGRIWVSKFTAPAPPDAGRGVRDAIQSVIESLQHPKAWKSGAPLPEVTPVEAEWTGYRAGATKESRLPPISEEEKYAEMMKECKSSTTILYFHGGAYWLMDPATHRPATKKLAKLTGGRCYSVRYRLAPQNAFPAAVIDALVSYLTLLYPPEDAFHEAVAPEHLVIAGDSAGGNLAMALLQTLLELRRQNYKVSWYGVERELPLPAGVSVCSPWMDITHSMPSCTTNAAFDYLPVILDPAKLVIPQCDAWPAKPPRHNLYAPDEFLVHPLCTLLMARSWAGAPPVYLCTGWELLADEDKYTAAKLHADGVPVVFEEYEAMPHCFALVFTGLAASRRCLDGWTGFIRAVVEAPDAARNSSRFTTIKAKTLREVELDPEALTPFSEAQMRERIWARIGLSGVMEETAKL